MKKKIMIVAVLMFFIRQYAHAEKTTYIATNHRFNFIKLKELKPTVADARGMTHPMDVSEDAMRKALTAVKLDKSFLIKKELASLEVFNEGAVNFLAPNFVKAFKQASALDEVVFSFLSKDPIFILRNDHLNIGHAWMHGNELHIVFEKLHARVSGDYDARGAETKTISKARGIRVKLDYGQGQMPGSVPEEVVLDLGAANFASQTEPAAVTAPAVPEKGKKAAVASAPETAVPAEPAVDDARARLEKLKQLKKDGFITNKEYEEKRKEIVKGL